ncbi:MAG TPA: hypothetical protein VEL79_22075, partial [Vicinamibacterales bacterium]|nr:hypothetical protein [Vicinamibacterales bacterium]
SPGGRRGTLFNETYVGGLPSCAFRKVIDDPSNSVNQLCRSEVQDEPERIPGHLQVCLQLTSLCLSDSRNGFDVDDDSIFHDKIRKVCARDNQLFVVKRDCDFTSEVKLALAQFQGEAWRIGGLHTVRPNATMDRNSTTDNLFGNPIQARLSPHAEERVQSGCHSICQ